jgi:hypothetical protein
MNIITHCFYIKIFTLPTQSVSFCSNAPASPTRDSVVYGNGYLSFKNETFELAMTSYPRDFSLLTLRSTLNFSGTILKPKFSINPLSTLMLLPPVDIGEIQNIDCQKMIRKAKD